VALFQRAYENITEFIFHQDVALMMRELDRWSSPASFIIILNGVEILELFASGHLEKL